MSSLTNKNFAFNEMMVHVPLCTHRSPKNILVVGDNDDEFKEEINKHDVQAVYIDINELTSLEDKKFDCIIVTKKMLLMNFA